MCEMLFPDDFARLAALRQLIDGWLRRRWRAWRNPLTH
jgi:hypothetical protein